MVRAMSESTRVRRIDWLDAGLATLAEGGLASVRIGPLCRRVGVTTGSFYHHFAGRAAFLEALIDYWCESQVDAVISLVEADEGSPIERARKLERFAIELGIGPHDQAMRDWAEDAFQVEEIWRGEGELTPARKSALLRRLGKTTRVLYELDRPAFWKVYRHMQTLDASHVPETTRSLRLVSRLFGYPRAEALALFARRSRQALGIKG